MQKLLCFMMHGSMDTNCLGLILIYYKRINYIIKCGKFYILMTFSINVFE